jgi:hypothetical protein
MGRFPPQPCSRCHGTGIHHRRDPEDLKQTVSGRCGRCGGNGVEPRNPPFKGPFLTQPQAEWKNEQAYRKRMGLPPLIPRTAAQREIDHGRIPGFCGGELDE